MTHEPERVTVARHHVEMGRRIVGRQRQLIRLRKIRGLPTKEFETTLRTFERTLTFFEDDLDWLLGTKLP